MTHWFVLTIALFFGDTGLDFSVWVPLEVNRRVFPWNGRPRNTSFGQRPFLGTDNRLP